VKRILISSVIALGIHGILLGSDCQWLKGISVARSKFRNTTITLSFRHPQKPANIKTEMKRPNLPPKTPDSLKTSIKKQVNNSIPKSNLKKTVIDNSNSKVESEQNKSNVNMLPLQFTKEARPLYRLNPLPEYPKIARKRGYQGSLVLEVLVNGNGKVVDLRVIKASAYPILDKAAINTVKGWSFEPGMVGKERVSMWVNIPIKFELK
jgi:TonB family protein